MGLKQILLMWAVTLLLLSACSRDEGPATDSLPPDGMPATEPAATPSPLPAATLPPTSTPAPTPIVPSINVDTPTLKEDGRLMIDSVVIPDAGWIVLYKEANGEAGDILGFEPLQAGENSPVTITIEPRDATPTLIARLHEDAGTDGLFEYPGLDIPLDDGSDIVAETFQVDIQLPTPSIEVTDQVIAADGLVHVGEVFALEPGWLVIHDGEDSKVGPALGQLPVQPGQNNDLAFPIRWQIASTKLMAILYLDKEQPGGFDQDADLPVLDGGSAVVAEFSVTLPPDIFVYDQPLLDGKITIERATSDGPGWIAAYYDDEGQPGLIIGFAYLEDGVNELVELELLETAVTPRLFLILHEDSSNLGEFDFPAGDLPVIKEGDLLPPFVVQTAPGNYLITQDQPLTDENSITVPLVVTDLDAWLVIYDLDETGEANEIIGQTWLPAGINRHVSVTIDPARTGETFLAILHQDNAPLEQFDFPGGADTPLLRNLLPIQSPFTLADPQEKVQPLP